MDGTGGWSHRDALVKPVPSTALNSGTGAGLRRVRRSTTEQLERIT
jgi:hypothetical protein